ncbi:caspase family protein [Nocardia sp. CA-129566]|uniref:caspase family protein n=1 Tax=Nocardia sp. CA-129566 TaxID=3239976 RepID=UPI003D97DA58
MPPRYPHRATSRAVLIGTGTYDHYDQLPHIPAVFNNLSDLHALLTGTGGAFEPAHCSTVPDPGSSSRVGEILGQATGEATDTLLLYYTGHGVLDRQGRLHLSLTGTHPDRPGFSALPYSTVREAILDSRAAVRIVILDCCFSGRAFDALASGPTAVIGHTEIAGTYVITSSARNETSWAPKGDRNTAFTAALLATASTYPGLDLDDLYSHVERELHRRGQPQPQRSAVNTAGRLALFTIGTGSGSTTSAPPKAAQPSNNSGQSSNNSGDTFVGVLMMVAVIFGIVWYANRDDSGGGASQQSVTSTTRLVVADPSFTLQGANPTGRCNPGCPLHATFKNDGGPGPGTATLWVTGDKGDDGRRALASCTIAIPHTSAGGTVSVDCIAASSELDTWYQNYPGLPTWVGASAR